MESASLLLRPHAPYRSLPSVAAVLNPSRSGRGGSVRAGPRVRPGPGGAARQDGAGAGTTAAPGSGACSRTRARTALRGARRRQGPAPVRVRRRRRVQVHPAGPHARAPRAPERQGVREVVPVRGAEQDPLVLPEAGARAQERAAEEAPALHARDRRRPVLPHTTCPSATACS
jgi:hypothetical protein